MYSERELTRLAAHKAALRRRIAHRRADCARLAARLAQPVAWFDRVVDFWRRLPPLAKLAVVPLGLLAKRALTPKRGIIGTLLRWGPLAFGAMRAVRAAVKTGGRG